MPTGTAPTQTTAAIITSGAEPINDVLPPNHGQI